MSRYKDLEELKGLMRAAVQQQAQPAALELVSVLRSVVEALAKERINNGMARSQYIQSVDVAADLKHIRLADGSRWALRLEQGGPRLDMREYMLKGGMTFRNVPMDRSMSSAKAYATQEPNRPEWSKTSIIQFLQTKIHTMTTVRDESGKARLVVHKEGQRMPAGTVHKIKAEHVADPFARMVKLVQTYEKSTQTTGLRIWRRISEKGRGDTWMQPEQKPLNILKDAVRHPEYMKGISSYRETLVSAITQSLLEALHG